MTVAEHRNQIRGFEDTDLMQRPCAAGLYLLHHMHAPLMTQPLLRDNVFGLIKAAPQSANRSWTLR